MSKIKTNALGNKHSFQDSSEDKYTLESRGSVFTLTRKRAADNQVMEVDFWAKDAETIIKLIRKAAKA